MKDIYLKVNNINVSLEQGFSLVEVVTVIAVLSTLLV